MKPLILIFFLFIATSGFAQDDMVSSFKPKTKTEKLVIAKLKSLSEIKELYAQHPGKDYKFDIMIKSTRLAGPKLPVPGWNCFFR